MSLAGWFNSAATAMTWPVLAGLVAVSALHYVAAAIAVRAASGASTPFAELVAAQLAASAANRITPAGLGGAGVLTRYLTRRGGMTPAAATAAVSSLAVLGGAADVAAFAILIAIGALFGVAGAGREVPDLVSRLAGLLPFHGSRMTLGIVAAAVVLLTMTILVLRRRRPFVRARRLAVEFRDNLIGLVTHPLRVAALVAASAGTTLLLSAGFATAAIVGPANRPATTFGALMIGYMVASAAGNALPVPGGIGTTDAAFIGVLVAAQAPLAAAVSCVLAFRMITFWAPALVGIGAGHRLRRRHAL